ncbi:protein kinase superfamily protein [Striga asiatica]|uniref:Protein kinase superfamily protein n=1 Tax=Striga asiatica TaxID=4170 RepID=A0A5A7QV17_STRAF|nr:protein kinase superfamily protein [Striga asiatica]
MSVILASHSKCCLVEEIIINHKKPRNNLSFSGSLVYRNNSVKAKKPLKFRVKAQDRKLLSRHGKVIEMVPTPEIRERMELCRTSSRLVSINGVNVIKEVGLVKKDPPNLPGLKEIPIVLPADDKGFSWANENYNSVQRSIDVWSSVISLRVRIFLDTTKWTYIGGFTQDKQLGPTFIKLGQLVSSRSDIFPKEYVDELAKLQDKVPAFSMTKAISFVESELGASIDVLFKEFEGLPIAAASLGQVHRAILHSGEKVVVKVQRPGLKKLFDIDLRNLKLITEYFQRSETLGGPSRDWIGLYEECSKDTFLNGILKSCVYYGDTRILYQEIDYVNEAKNADRFRREFRNIKWVRVPMVYWDYTAMKVLTLEYVPGIKINQLDLLDKKGYNRSRISSRAVESFLIQILRTGFYHADPHPGNLAIDEDEALIFYDFGMMGEIKSFTRDRLLGLFYAVYEKDAKKVMKRLVDLGALQPTGDMLSVRRSVQFFLNNLLTEGQKQQQQTFTAIGEDLFAIAMDQPFRFPSTFAFVVRAFSTLEGIGHMLNPKFSFVKVAAPYAQELLDLRHEHQQSGVQVAQAIRKQAEDARSNTMSMPYRIHRIENVVKQLESGDLKLRVRVLESERAARKATILHMATIYTILWGTFLNLGVTLINQSSRVMANGTFVVAGVFFALLVRSMQRVRRLDKFEKML